MNSYSFVLTLPRVLVVGVLTLIGVMACSSGAQKPGSPNSPSGGGGDGNRPMPTIIDPEEIDAWTGEEARPDLEGESSLALTLTATRAQAVAPAAIRFTHDGPLADSYYWDFGNETTMASSQAAVIYEQPGNYTVEVVRLDPTTRAWGIATVEIEVLPFSGATHYIDGEGGDDGNSGDSPAQAWRSASKVHEHLTGASQENQRFLFKRGQSYPITDGRFMETTRADRLRFGAYATGEGTDDPSLPVPEIVVSGETSSSFMVNTFATNNDIVFRDLKFSGNYEYQPPPNPATTRQDFGTFGIGTIDTTNFVLLRVELTALGTGIYMQGNAENFFIHDSRIHHVQVTPVFGSALGLSIQDSTLASSAQSHLSYLGVDEGVIRGNLFQNSGMSVDTGRDPWFQCGLRLNSNNDARTNRVYVARNRIESITGSNICVGQNNANDPHTTEVVFEANILDGTAPDVGESWNDASIVGISSSEDIVFRNNVFLNPRNHVQLEQTSGGVATSNIDFFNNTFVLADYDRPVVRLRGGEGAVGNVSFTNNIVTGASTVLRTDASLRSELTVSSNLFFNGGSQVSIDAGGGSVSVMAWEQGTGNLSVDPQLQSLEPDDENFALPAGSSPAKGAGADVPVIADFSAELRDGNDVGAREID